MTWVSGPDDSEHFYDPEREVLEELGYEPSCTLRGVFERNYDIVEATATESRLTG